MVLKNTIRTLYVDKFFSSGRVYNRPNYEQYGISLYKKKKYK